MPFEMPQKLTVTLPRVLVDVEEAAALLGISKADMIKLLKNPKRDSPRVVKLAGQIHIPVTELVRWADANMVHLR